MKPIELGSNSDNLPQAVFIALISEVKIWQTYDGISKEAQETSVPLVLMLQRWDGLKGFVGGEVEPEETLKETVSRECREEIGFNLTYTEIQSAGLVSSHQTDKLVTHLMAVHISPSRMIEAIKGASRAEHFMSETVAAMPVQFINYPHKKSFDNFIKNNFASTVKEEIADLILALGWDKTYSLPIDFVPKNMTQKGVVSQIDLLSSKRPAL